MSILLVMALALLIGVVCGLRSFTGPALVCWGAHLGWLNLAGSRLSFLAHVASLVVLSLFAVAELVADKLPKIPRRTSAGPLIWRILMGGLCAAAIGIAGNGPFVTCCIFGGVGGFIGAFAGYGARHVATAAGTLRDFPVAIIEDLIAIGGGLFLVTRL